MEKILDFDSLSYIISFLGDKSATNVMQCCNELQFRERLKNRYNLRYFCVIDQKPWGILRKEIQKTILKKSGEHVNSVRFCPEIDYDEKSIHIYAKHNYLYFLDDAELFVSADDIVETIETTAKTVTLSGTFPNLKTLSGNYVHNVISAAETLTRLDLFGTSDSRLFLPSLEVLTIRWGFNVEIIAPNLRYFDFSTCPQYSRYLSQETVQNLETLLLPMSCSVQLTHFTFPKLVHLRMHRDLPCELKFLDAPNLKKLELLFSPFGDAVRLNGLKNKLHYLDYDGSESVHELDCSELKMLILRCYHHQTKLIKAPRLEEFHTSYFQKEGHDFGIFNVPTKYWRRWQHVSQHIASKKYSNKFKLLRQKALHDL